MEAGATLTIQPDVVVKFKHEHPDDYYGITVEGTLIADGGDSTTAILFTPLPIPRGLRPGQRSGHGAFFGADGPRQYAGQGAVAARFSVEQAGVCRGRL